jgi:protein gp37
MSQETDIEWCDGTVNPIMGCPGCELYPSPEKVLFELDGAIQDVAPNWSKGTSRGIYRPLIREAYASIEAPQTGHRDVVSTTNLWHFRLPFISAVRERAGEDAAEAAQKTIEQQVTCYAATQHLNKGRSLLNPLKSANSGFAPTFEQVTRYSGRVSAAARWPDLLGTHDAERLWINGLPRLIFVSDMGDALSSRGNFQFLRTEVIDPVNSEEGKRHLWLWLTKRPELMVEFSELVGGLPENICAMTTVTGMDRLGRIDDLRKVRASIRGLSVEPLWERIPPSELNLDGIDWLILGGESGSTKEYARPFALEWVEELQEHCRSNGVAFFLKQLGRRPTQGGVDLSLADKHGGEWDEWPETVPRIREFPKYFHEYRKHDVGGSGPRRKHTPRTKVKKEMIEKLPPEDRADFARLDKIVSKFARETIHAAEALYEIRSRRLYRAKHKTFSEYCEAVHNMSRHYANRLIQAGKIRAEMVPIVTNLGLPEPSNEAQLRELARLKTTEEQVAVYSEAAVKGTNPDGTITVTAKLLSEVIDLKQQAAEGAQKPEPKSSPQQRLTQARSLIDELKVQHKLDKKILQVLAQIGELLESPQQKTTQPQE